MDSSVLRVADYMWMGAFTASKPLLAHFGAVARPDWQSGIYWLPAAQRTVIVSIEELPVTPETLRLRILGRGFWGAVRRNNR